MEKMLQHISISISADDVVLAARWFSFITAFLLAAVILGGFVFVIGVVIYRRFFHPYRKYPGPFLASISDLYSVWHAWKGDIHIDHLRCHAQYGDVVRYGPNRLAINTIEALTHVHGSGKRFQKAKGYLPMVHLGPNTFTFIDKKEHFRRRRILGPAFTDSSLKRMEPAIVSHVEKFCSILSRPGDFNMSRLCDYLFFDTMTQLVFGESRNMLERTDERDVIEALSLSNIRMSVLCQAPYLCLRRFDRKILPKRLILGRNRFIKFMARIVQERIKLGDKGSDIFSVMLKESETGRGFGAREVAAEASTLIVAGSDTSATLLTTLFFYLSRNPQAYSKAASEVRTAFSSIESIRTGVTLNSCKYLASCIDESLRMSPPVGGQLLREAEEGGAFVGDIYIPEGFDVGTGIYSIHHNERYYPAPFQFRPERWLVGVDGTTAEQVRVARAAATPFGLGPRTCLGKSMALAQAMLAMAHVLYRMDFETADQDFQRKEMVGGMWNPTNGRISSAKPVLGHSDTEFQVKDHLTSHKNGPFLRFSPRNLEQSKNVNNELSAVALKDTGAVQGPRPVRVCMACNGSGICLDIDTSTQSGTNNGKKVNTSPGINARGDSVKGGDAPITFIEVVPAARIDTTAELESNSEHAENTTLEACTQHIEIKPATGAELEASTENGQGTHREPSTRQQVDAELTTTTDCEKLTRHQQAGAGNAELGAIPRLGIGTRTGTGTESETETDFVVGKGLDALPAVPLLEPVC